MIELTKDQPLHCPHCGTLQEEPVSEYVVPGREGPASRAEEQCYNCDKYFTVEKLPNGNFGVN